MKVWSPFQLPNTSPEMINANGKERPVYSHEEYINLILNSGQFMSHDYSNQSVEEDPRMIAFFDSLVQRELEGNSSDPDMSSGEEEMYERIIQLSRSDISDSSEDEVEVVGSSSERHDQESDTDSIDDPAFSPFTLAFASVMAAQATDGNPSASRLLNALSGENGHQTNSENQNSWRSISDLIAQKRNEMKKRIQHGVSSKRKRNQTDFSDSTDDEQHASEGLSGHPENILAAHRQRRQLHLKRLRQLRNNALQMEEENCEENDMSSASVNCQSEPSTSKGNTGLGPFLSENNKSNSVHNSCVDSNREAEKLCGENSLHHQPKVSVGDNHGDNQQPCCSHDNEENSEEEGRRQKWTGFKNRTKKNKRVYRNHSDRDDI